MLGFTSLLLTLAGLLDRALRRDDRARPLPRPLRLGRGDHACSTRFGSLALDFVLGQPVPAGPVLVGPARRPSSSTCILTWPVYCFVRRLFPPAELSDRVHEVRLLG